jgi:hypothetical protein
VNRRKLTLMVALLLLSKKLSPRLSALLFRLLRPAKACLKACVHLRLLLDPADAGYHSIREHVS